jgi:SAM-dependent methyltransferase
MSIHLNAIVARPPLSVRSPSYPPAAMPGSRAARSDIRWPEIASALAGLRAKRRHAVRIVDADCACGALLIEVVRHARAIGFTAIEGRGIDGSPAMIGRARAAAARVQDPAIGLEFQAADMMTALLDENDLPADIVLWHGDRSGDRDVGVEAVLAMAGDRVIRDPAMAGRRGRAA